MTSKSDLVFNILEIIFFVFGSGANLVLLYAFVHRLRTKSTPNSSVSQSTYLVMFHISVDFCWSLSSLLVVAYALPGEIFPAPLCRGFGFSNHFVAGVSMVFMVIMAFERYLTIVRGPGSASTFLLIGLTAACIVVCVVYAILPLVGVGLYANHDTTYTCFATKNPDYVVDPFLILSMLIIFGCVNLISILFYLIFRHVRAVTSAVASNTRRSALSVEVEIAKSFLFSVCFFLFAWTPLAILWLMQMNSVPYSQALVYVALLNGASYSIGNPMLYVVFNKNVRKMVLEILPSWFSVWLDRKLNDPSSSLKPMLVSSPQPRVSAASQTPDSMNLVSVSKNGNEEPTEP
eukprot:TRINITY_DN1684_c0_g1_i2.p1 TRINITY_DN1684_c0_g1~~TRINITY_DN1684_c0_g1_i2.p1  ORF type:complete len:366 (+),score=49.97 TRINITY_DN1684_c0_g1_i2:59-1099(+)